MTLTARRIALSCPALLVVTVFAQSFVVAGKPVPPAPVPPGRIYFEAPFGATVGGDPLYSMAGDGSNNTLEWNSHPARGVPSSRAYDSAGRWWLTVATLDNDPLTDDRELFAVRLEGDAVRAVQLTAFYPAVAATEYCNAWSNDGVDSFISGGFVAPDHSGMIVRLNISGAEIDALDIGGFLPLLPTEAEVVLEDAGNVETPGLSWSPDGSAFVYRGFFPSIDVVDVATGARLTVATDGLFPRWSPDGRQISFARTTTFSSSIHTVRPDGNDLKTVAVADSAAARYGQVTGAHWSPDSQHLAFHGSERKRGTWQALEVYRIPAGGGTMVRLTSDRVNKWVIAWVP